MLNIVSSYGQQDQHAPYALEFATPFEISRDLFNEYTQKAVFNDIHDGLLTTILDSVKPSNTEVGHFLSLQGYNVIHDPKYIHEAFEWITAQKGQTKA